MTDDVIVWTYDWVPNGPRGHVRDIRLRWALEEAGIGYVVKGVAFDQRTEAAHLERQPFAQVPYLDFRGVRLCESGACLLTIAEASEVLMPRDPQGRAEVVQWLMAGLNSVEMVSVPWWFIGLGKPEVNPLAGWMQSRFQRLEAALAGRDWLTGQFSVADIMMADALRMPGKLGALAGFPGLVAYVERACGRGGFRKALADQMAHFSAADAGRG